MRNYDYGREIIIPESKKITCKICFITDNTGTGDLDEDYHKGFTIGNGKALYWMMVWHKSGHCTVYRADNEGEGLIPRWINGDTIITIHFK